MTMRTAEIIAECEINHNGDVELGKKLISAAKEAGASCVKFQCMVPTAFIAPVSSFMPLFENVALPVEAFVELKRHSDSIGMPIFSTAVDREGLAMIRDIGFDRVKIGSTNITHIDLLEEIAELKRPVYLSTGASNLSEIDRALSILSRGTDDLTLFHCTALYPAPNDRLNMSAMDTLKNAFPGVPIAYSDHSVGTTAAVIAVSKGAVALEKHFTLDHDLPGPDHKFSADPEEMAAYVATVRIAESMLGSPAKVPAVGEDAIRRAGRRYLTALTDIAVGEKITNENTRPRRIMVEGIDLSQLIEACDVPRVKGWTAQKSIGANASIAWSDLAGA